MYNSKKIATFVLRKCSIIRLMIGFSLINYSILNIIKYCLTDFFVWECYRIIHK